MALRTFCLKRWTQYHAIALANEKPFPRPWKLGGLLTKAKGRLHHGEWGDWLHRVGLAPRTASMWMKLAAMDVTAEDVIERGGIVQTLRGGTPKSATVADLPDSNLGRDLAEAEAEIADTKQAYYDALSRRNRALRALAREGGDE